jgi:hypothetical protein
MNLRGYGLDIPTDLTILPSLLLLCNVLTLYYQLLFLPIPRDDLRSCPFC